MSGDQLALPDGSDEERGQLAEDLATGRLHGIEVGVVGVHRRGVHQDQDVGRKQQCAVRDPDRPCSHRHPEVLTHQVAFEISDGSVQSCGAQLACRLGCGGQCPAGRGDSHTSLDRLRGGLTTHLLLGQDGMDVVQTLQ